MKTRNSITRTEVAKLAGLSHMTVTRVLSGHPNVSPHAKEAVLAACKALHYRRNTVASSLRSRHSHSIGVLVPTFKHSFYGRLLTQLEIDARAAGYHLIVVQGNPKKERIDLNWADIEFLLSRQIDGLVVDITLPPTVEARLAQERVPVVFVDAPPKLDSFDFVGTQEEEAMGLLVGHLIGLGHRRIAFLAGFHGSRTSEPRLAGYRQQLQVHGIPFDAGLVRHGNFHYDGGYATAKQLLEHTRDFTALVGASDYIAIGAMAALQEAGIDIPGRVSIGGFSGDESGAFTHPTLTTVEQPIEQIATEAFVWLRRRIQTPDVAPRALRLPGRLIRRASCAAPSHP